MTNPEEVSRLTAKIADGSELIEDDLRIADGLLKDGGDGGGGVDGVVPALTRSFLRGWNGSGDRPQVVRYLGMVQNMLEPEYYVSSLADGKSTHFRDVPADHHLPEELVLASNLAERIPLMIVPLPFASDWFAEPTPPLPEALMPSRGASASSVQIPESPLAAAETEATATATRKRHRDACDGGADGNDDVGDSFGGGDSCKPRVEDGMDYEMPDGLQGQELDWWPQGCMGSSAGQCPVLAKLYYDQRSQRDHRQRKLRLNDVVELVGVLSMDPWEAAFTQEDDPYFFGTTPPPPPSRLPRVHVLSYAIADLDSLARSRIAREQELAVDHEGQPSIAMASPSPTVHNKGVPSPAAPPLTEIAASIFKDPILAEAICVTLLSKAQRELQKDDDSAIQRAGPSQNAIGCLSLQISTDSSKKVFRQMSTILHEVCPVLATIDLSKGQRLEELFPIRVDGRMRATPWQLPRGSTLLVHLGKKCFPSEEREFLEELLGRHRIPYRFDGGVKVDFDADFRIIVVASSQNTSTMPCYLHLKLSREWDIEMSKKYLLLLRRRLLECQAKASFRDDVLKVAQDHFIAEREKARSENATPPQGEDLHRLLVLSRLQAGMHGHGSTVVTLRDWQKALALDQALRL